MYVYNSSSYIISIHTKTSLLDRTATTSLCHIVYLELIATANDPLIYNPRASQQSYCELHYSSENAACHKNFKTGYLTHWSHVFFKYFNVIIIASFMM